MKARIIALLQLRKESLKKIRACTGFEPLTSAIPVQRSKPTGSRSLWLIHWYEILPIHDKKRTSLYFKSSIFSHNFTSKHRTDNLLCFYTLVKAQEAQFLTACLFAECLQLVMKLECHGTRRHYMVANLQNNFEAKHFNLKSLVADLFVSLAW